MSNSKIAAQLYTLRDFMKTPKDIATTLAKVKKMGYDAVQLSGLGPIDPKQLQVIVEREQLTVAATHVSFERMQDDIEAVINEHKLWNCRYVGIGGLPGAYQTSREGYERFAKEASVVAKVLDDNGLRFIYHNHHFEFQKFGDAIGLEILYRESDPKVFDFELDTYWVQTGGGDSAAWIRKFKDRMKVIHLKDMSITEDRKQVFAEIGEGNLNWPSILEACREIGIEWYIVEQDTCQRDPFESLAISLRNLKVMSLQ